MEYLISGGITKIDKFHPLTFVWFSSTHLRFTIISIISFLDLSYSTFLNIAVIRLAAVRILSLLHVHILLSAT